MCKQLYNVLSTPSDVGEAMLADYFDNYPQTTTFTQYAQPKDVVKAFESAVYVAYINEKQTADAAKLIWSRDALKDCLNLAQKMPVGETKAVLDELSEVTKNAVFTAIGNKTYTSADALVNEFEINTLFNAIEYADNYNDVQKVLVAYNKAGKIQINISGKATSKV